MEGQKDNDVNILFINQFNRIFLKKGDLRKLSKEHKEDSERREKAFQAELGDMIKGPPVETLNARMPAYTYTGLYSESGAAGQAKE